MAVRTETWQLKPVPNQCLRVTKENFDEVADWCEGSAVPPARRGPLEGMPAVEVYSGSNYVYAYPGDWIVKAGANTYHVLDEETFKLAYERVRPTPVQNNQ